jgi:hypothetical protein
MAAPKGNRFWEVRSTHGKSPIFATPDDLWTACCEYFAWVEENPLIEERLFSSEGAVIKGHASKMRAMTIQGLCNFLDIGDTTWYEYAQREGYAAICARAKRIIYAQKLEGAAADLLNASIIARELGLKERSETELTGANGGPIQAITREMTAEEAARAYRDLMG